MGSTKTISTPDSKAFAKEIAKYIDSKDHKRGKKDKEKSKPKEPSLMDKVRKIAGTSTSKKTDQDDADAPALWPLIRQVNVRCRANALSTGAILVDLPGTVLVSTALSPGSKTFSQVLLMPTLLETALPKII